MTPSSRSQAGRQCQHVLVGDNFPFDPLLGAIALGRYGVGLRHQRAVRINEVDEDLFARRQRRQRLPDEPHCQRVVAWRHIGPMEPDGIAQRGIDRALHCRHVEDARRWLDR